MNAGEVKDYLFKIFARWKKFGIELKVGSILLALVVINGLFSTLFQTETPSTRHLFTDNIDSFICKAATAANMGRPVSIMTSSRVGNKYHITYVRTSDNTSWGVYCWDSYSRILWQTDGRDNNGVPGRVRDGEWDEFITYNLEENVLTINIKYSDGSEKKETYTIPSSYKVNAN